MRIPVECPVCGADHIQPIQGQTLVKPEDESRLVAKTIAFRCGSGHTFVVSEAELLRVDKDANRVDS
jgi:hypothetical protein